MQDRGRFLKRLLLGAAMVGLVVLMGSCSGHDPQDTLNPQGHVAAIIKGLFYPVFWLAVVPVFILVEGLILFIVVRFRDRGGRELPVQTHGNTTLEIGWTIAPTLILAIVSVFTISTLIDVNSTPANAMQIDVVAHQWWWEFDYTSLNPKIVTADELHIPAGTPIRVNLHSADVIHSFWVPSLAGKTDIIPNRNNGLWFNAYQPGVFDAQCAQFCGVEHGKMRFEVVAQSQADFNAWVKDQQAPAANLTSAGAKTFLNGPCVACHTINGTVAQGTIGPNLTHFASRAWFEEMTNNQQDVATWLTDPQAVKSGNKMPNYHLSNQDIQTLSSWLETLK